MGFNSEWVSIMKGIAVEAFTAKACAPNLRGAFIDGQIQLMKPLFIDTMDLFFKVQFTNVINRYLSDGSPDMVVVLCFDDYNNVPSCKSMTQLKRKQRVVDVLPFTETDDIPSQKCPANWEGAMCNRVFKTKLIRRITEKMGSLIKLRGPGQRVVVDFIGDPIEYSTVPGGMAIVGIDEPMFARHMTGGMFAPIGEADCKMPRWVDYISSLHPNVAVDVIVDATDSDYIMIAMLHYEKQSRQIRAVHTAAAAAAATTNLGRISIRRMVSHAKQHAAGEVQRAKRARTAAAGDSTAATTTKSKRVMEFVHVPLLSEVMSTIVQQMFSCERSPPLRCLAGIVALGGNDFCRSIPQIGPHRMWELLPLVLRDHQKMRQAVSCKKTKLDLFSHSPSHMVREAAPHDPRWEMLHEGVLRDVIIARLYSHVYSRHCAEWDAASSFQGIRAIIVSSECKLSQSTKQAFPTRGMLTGCVRNSSWNLMYWLSAVHGTMLGVCPDPLSSRYAYELQPDGKPGWMDVAAA